jgi:hypothetical protein
LKNAGVQSQPNTAIETETHKDGYGISAVSIPKWKGKPQKSILTGCYCNGDVTMVTAILMECKHPQLPGKIPDSLNFALEASVWTASFTRSWQHGYLGPKKMRFKPVFF